MPSVRYPAVAGAFYPGDRFKLALVAKELLSPGKARIAARAVVVPHAGYVYSGSCAGDTLAGVEIPQTVILLGPNHTGRGAALAAAEEESWTTPLGPTAVDRALLEALAARCGPLVFDSAAHRSEHCLEVQLPLLQTLRPDVKIAPVVVGTNGLTELRALGEALAEVISAAQPTPLILVSSDMTHYESAAQALEKDELALERLEAVDPEGLHEVAASRSISMCGVAPATAALVALREMGITHGERICYTHSGVVTGDLREVVAYAGLVYRA